MRRKKATRRRKSKGLSAAPRRRRRGLSAGFSGQGLKNSLLDSGYGAVGGLGAHLGNKALAGFKLGTMGKILAAAVGGFALSSFGAPKMGIGFVGGLTALTLNDTLKEDAQFAEEDVLEEGEIYQTESGEFVKMLNDGTIEPLSEDEQAALSEGDIYPPYSTMAPFQM